MRKAALSLPILLFVISCSKSDPLPTSPIVVSPGKLVINAIDVDSSAGVPDVVVEIRRAKNQPLVMSGRTNASGVYEHMLEPTGYSIHAIAPAGYTRNGSAEVESVELTVDSGGTAGFAIALTRVQ